MPADPKAEEVALAYLDTQEDWLSPENSELVLAVLNSARSPLFDFVVENMDEFGKTYSTIVVERRLEQILYMELYNPDLGPDILEKAEHFFTKIEPSSDAEMLNQTFKSFYYLTD